MSASSAARAMRSVAAWISLWRRVCASMAAAASSSSLLSLPPLLLPFVLRALLRADLPVLRPLCLAQPVLRLGEHACKCSVQAVDEAVGSARELVGWGWVLGGASEMASAVDGLVQVFGART